MVNSPVKNGVILGVIMCVAALAMAFIAPRPYVIFGRTALLIAVFYFMYKIGKDEKIRQEGSLDYGEAFKAIFIGSIVGYLIFSIFEYVLYNYIRTDLDALTYEVMLESVNGVMDWIASIADTDEEAMARAKEEIATELTVDQVSRNVGNTLVALFSNLIFPCLIGGLFMAMITKSKHA